MLLCVSSDSSLKSVSQDKIFIPGHDGRCIFFDGKGKDQIGRAVPEVQSVRR
jgi:hypothetical protein